MKTYPVFPLLFAALLAGANAEAQEKPTGPLPIELATAAEQQAAVERSAATRREDQLTAARTWYIGALEKLQADATTRGELDAVVALKAERERVAANQPDAKAALPAAAQPYRQRYDQTVAQIVAQARTLETAALRSYLTTLDDLQKRVTIRGDIDGALKVREERASIAARLATLTAATARETPAGPPAPAAPPSPPVATPPTSLPLAAQPIAVADLIQARGKVEGLAPNVLVFDGPAGDGRRGTKGLLWKSDPASLRGGSTWTFRYTRGGAAQTMQIIHPNGRGQVIVHLGTKSVGLSSPKAWIEVGLGSGNNPRVKETKAFDEIFPLKDGQEYVVISRLSTGGALEVFINDKLVATGHIAGAEALSLKIPEGKSFPGAGRGNLEFKGPDLPLQWAAGWGGLILGPLDSGENTCRDVRFYPGLADLGPGKR